jgi:hypothetical protein
MTTNFTINKKIPKMKNSKIYLLIALCGLLAGCTTQRSISNSGYRDEDRNIAGFIPRANDSDPGFTYRGELSEFDVLGIERGEAASDLEIQKALDNAKSVKLNANSSILLIQSGAIFPDAPMVKELGRYFHVSPFSGVPPTSRHADETTTETRDPHSFAQSLRLAAARGGNDFVLCYWGVLESEKQDLVTKTVSWLPTAGWVLPDEKQHMRIRIKLALIDVRSGSWTVMSPEAFDDSRMSTSLKRAARDQQQVELLKAKAYEASVKELVAKYSLTAMARE